MLADAMDAEELFDYNSAVLMSIAFNNPKALKKWQWQSMDKAGTRPTGTKNAAQGMAQLALTMGAAHISEKLDNQQHIQDRIKQGREIAKAKNRPLMFMGPDGKLYDSELNLTDYIYSQVKQMKPGDPYYMAMVIRLDEIPVEH